MAEYFMTVVIFCYVSAEVWFLDTHSVSGCYNIDLSWYSVLLKLANYICEHWGL